MLALRSEDIALYVAEPSENSILKIYIKVNRHLLQVYTSYKSPEYLIRKLLIVYSSKPQHLMKQFITIYYSIFKTTIRAVY